MNNLNDISLDLDSATLLGYTQEEIEQYFGEVVTVFAKNQGIKTSTIKRTMEIWYNGYRFTGSTYAQKVYNPFSILYYLQKQQQKNYWWCATAHCFTSETPTFLVELLKEQYQLSEHFERFDNVIVSESSLGAFDLDAKLPLYALLFQTGYLTIKSYNSTMKAYTLGFPNEEVKVSLTAYLMAIVAHKDKDEVDSLAFALRTALNNNNLEDFLPL